MEQAQHRKACLSPSGPVAAALPFCGEASWAPSSRALRLCPPLELNDRASLVVQAKPQPLLLAMRARAPG